jgi:N-acetylmuramoyl-L-alanine amidase
VIERPSPNHDARPEDGAIDLLVLHYTGMETAEAALARLCDPQAKVSAHYLVDEDGAVTRLVDEDRRAWHAGVAWWRGTSDINARSIGVELVNPGHEFGYRPYPEAQMAALIELCRGILARHPIPPEGVLGHSDVAPGRKPDPGELFDWAALAAAGIGLWPAADFAPSPNAETLAPGASGAAVLDLQLALDGFGYQVQGTALHDPATEAVVAAFQRHWRPALIDGIADAETQSLLRHLLARAAS